MRLDGIRAREVAREFVKSPRARLWYFVTDDVRHALIDAAVMDCVRAAHAADNESTLTPDRLLEFRSMLLEALHEGVPMGSAGRRRCELDDRSALTHSEVG